MELHGAYGALITGLRRQDGEIFAFSPELELVQLARKVLLI